MSEQPKPNLAEVCEHGTLKRRCDSCWAAKLEAENTAKAATLAALRAENIRLRGEVDMYKGALEMMQPAPKEQAEHGMGAMPPVPDEVAQLRAEVERAKSIIENYELDYDRVVVRGEKCAMEQAVEEAATLRAEVERLKKREEAWIDLSRENNEHYDELNKLCDTFGPNTEGDTYHGFLSKHITQLREDRRVLRSALEELVAVASLRGDNDLPHPSNDPKLWTARMQQAWDDATSALLRVK